MSTNVPLDATFFHFIPQTALTRPSNRMSDVQSFNHELFFFQSKNEMTNNRWDIIKHL